MVSQSAASAGEFDRREPIPGYRTLELLGRGGCGEVWKATAPGGLEKAVKIVFGDPGNNQTSMEMRALARIRDVRHPLLLSIERIEVQHGNLVIVTELADCSLKQHFLKCCDSGGSGVPRKELLRYLADVAEGLDFLYEKYSLQHLDVKPENILLVSGRAKLGDFGLVKNLYERSVSLIGGLTPTYAPPELFEGRPTRHSDQYSLALVYMQMLTGVLPYVASNTAQIAEQHLRGVPDLMALSRQEGTVIARALSKDPQQRFESCTAMVEALKACHSAETRPSLTRETAGPVRPGTIDTPAGEGDGSGQAIRPGSATRRLPINGALAEPSAEVVRDTERASDTRQHRAVSDCPPVPEGRPTLIVGVGGSGTAVLQKFVDRLRDQYGPVSEWPPVEFLALDTDTREMTSRFSSDVLDRVRIVPIPLAEAETYGARSREFLGWLGRRWLYNIPRDQSTDGFRPLGRLALMTHAVRVREEISSVLTQLDSHAGDPASSPRVLLLGSINGGTGSGAMIDIAYAVRSELKQRGRGDDNVQGVLLHATPRSNADRDKARANAYAMLSELDHYNRPGSFYPGEPLLGSNPFHGDNAVFARTHMLQPGSGLGQSEWNLALEHAADFLYCMSLSAEHDILDTGSEASDSTAQSYDVLALGADRTGTTLQCTNRAIADVVRLWREGRPPAAQSQDEVSAGRTVLLKPSAATGGQDDIQISEVVAEKLSDCGINFETLLEEAVTVAVQEAGAELESFLTRLVDETLAATRKGPTQHRIETMTGMIDSTFSRECESLEEMERESFYESVVGQLIARMRNRTDELIGWVGSQVDSPETRIEGARTYALAARQSLATLLGRITKQLAAISEAAIACSVEAKEMITTQPEASRFSGWRFRREDPDEKFRAPMIKVAGKRLEEMLHHCVIKLVRTLDAELVTQIERIDRLSRTLNQLAAPVLQAGAAAGPDSSETGKPYAMSCYQQMLRGRLAQCRQEIASRVESRIDSRVFDGGPGLSRFLDPEVELRQVLSGPLAETSRQVVLDCILEFGCELLENCGRRPENVGGGIGADLQHLIAVGFSDQAEAAGGAVARKLLVVPSKADVSHLQEQVDSLVSDTSIVKARKSDVMLCSVHPPRRLHEFAEAIIDQVAVYRDLAAKLYTRSDIQWKPFTKPARTARPIEAASEDASMHTAVLSSQ